ncbi:MAG: carboxypeptidase regulatory-like domain-containing protein [Candidatus Latescibacteria bacterium]|jgi:hypothetical protein|nr:carboxypeptidase regulatory-like domain-containing protein [Candidatus Latescibacterota bacterium]
MKESVRVISISLLAMIVFGCSGLFDDDKPKDKPPPPPPEAVAPESVSTYKFSGQVVDGDNQPITNVKLIYMGASTGTIFSGDNGKFSASGVLVGQYTLTALKSGYTYGEIKFSVSESGASVPNILLSNIREIESRQETETTANDIMTAGASVSSTVNEDVSAGGNTSTSIQKETKADIPQGTEITIAGETVTADIVLAAAPLEVNEIPPPESEDEMSFGAAVFSPQDAEFSQPVEIKVPMEIQLPAGIQIPMKKYIDGEWIEVATATIDESGMGADADVTEFGQFAIQPKVDVVVEEDPAPSEEVSEEVEVPAEQESFQAEVTDSVEFPGGLPEGVTNEYAISLIEQMKGTTIGVPKSMTVDSPLLSTVSKIAKTQETWILTWTVENIKTKKIETITLSIEVQGTTIDFPIEYEYTEERWQSIIKDKTVKWWIDVIVNGVNGAKVTLSGDLSGSEIIKEDGSSIRFLGDTGGDYVLTPSKNGYDFTPETMTIKNIGTDIVKTFTAKKQLNKITISGTVTGADDVTMTLSGDESDVTTVKKSGGTYSFNVDPNKSYTVTPSKEGYIFDPYDASLPNITSNTTANFDATKSMATITGAANGANGVKVTLSGDSSGSFDNINAGDSYEFEVPVGGNYTVTATKGDYIVTPESVDFANISEDQVQDFLAEKIQNRVLISGSVEGANDVTVTLQSDDYSPKIAATGVFHEGIFDDGDDFSWEVKAGFTGTLSVSAPGVEFEESSVRIENLQTDYTLHFAAIVEVTISGTLKNADGNSITQVNVSYSVNGAYVETLPVDGSYSITVNKGSSVSITVDKYNYTWTPAIFNQEVNSNTQQNFLGTRKVRLKVTNSSSANGVVVSVSNTGDSVKLDAGDSFEFELPYGLSYLLNAVAGIELTETSKTFSTDGEWIITAKHDQGGGGN